MNLPGLALRNLSRRKGRTLFLVAGLTIGVATVVALFSITQAMRTELAKKLDEYGANILIVPESDNLALSFGGLAVSQINLQQKSLDTSALTAIRSIKNAENLNAIAPKLLGMVSSEKGPAVVMGVDFPQERKIKKWWALTGKIPTNPQEVLLGSRAATVLAKKIGDVLTLEGKTFTVSGIVEETGGSEDALVMTDLNTAQELLKKPNAISFIEVSAYCLTCPIEEIVQQLKEALPGTRVTALKQVVQAREENLQRFNNFSYTVGLIVLLLGGFMVGAMTMNSVLERTREIGIFRAIGFRRHHLVGIFVLEAVVIGLAAGIAGSLLGLVTARLLGPVLAQAPVSGWNIPLVLGGIGLTVLLSAVSSLYPAWRGANLEPTTAFRAL